jgi:hypothetical protein
MSDIFDLLGDSASKKPKKDDNAEQDDGLDFLGGFKKKVTGGDLKGKRQSDDADGGGLPIDIADLPADQKQVMFMMLRDRTAKTKGLRADEIAERVDVEDLQGTLETLVDNNWLVMRGDAYRVNFKRKKGRLDNLFSALED